MTCSLDTAAKDVFDAIAPILPRGDYMVWAEPGNDCIMIGTEETAITIRRKAVDAGLHIETAKALVPALLAAIEAAAGAQRKTLLHGLTVLGAYMPVLPNPKEIA